MMDRPHIVYNEKTKRFIAWLKIMGEPSCFAVLSAEHILGPYEMVNPRVNQAVKDGGMAGAGLGVGVCPLFISV